MAVGSKTKIK